MNRLATLLCCAVLAGAAGAAKAMRPAPDLLDLYAQAYAEGAFGFSCYPALYRGGPGHPRYERMRRALHHRRLRIRDRLVAEYVAERIETIEREHDEAEHGVYRTGCDLAETERARQRYRQMLQTLGQRLHLPR